METVSGSLIFVLLLIVGHHPSSAVLRDAEGRLLYRLTEEQPAGTLVANVLGDAGLSTDGGGQVLRYVILNQNDPGVRLFRIDVDGLLRTSAVIDHDVLCPGRSTCSIFLDVAVQRAARVDIVKIHVQLIDLNDNAPAFAEPEVEFRLAESTPPGVLFPLPVAADHDGPPNGVVGYRLYPVSDVFSVQLQNLSTGDVDVRLVLKRLLDRRRKDRYTFSLVAFDGGRPRRSGQVILNIYIDDVRRHSPRFDNASYEVLVPENSPPGSTIIQLHASAVPGATVVYSFSRRTSAIYGDIFAINTTTGEVTLLGAVDQATYNLSVCSILHSLFSAAYDGNNCIT